MNDQSLFPKATKAALKNNPPGAWMPALPKGCIRLSSGYPAPELIPSEQIKAAVDKLIQEEHDLPLHYLGSPRIKSLQRQIQRRLEERGISVREGELLITSGGCQAIDLIARTLLDEETAIAVESPSYMEALEIFQNYTNQIISVPVDERGLQTNTLETILAERKRDGLTLPRFLYTIPSFHNPTGTTMTPERRSHLLELSIKFDFLIVEDDAYGELAFLDSPTPIKASDSAGRVLHIGSLSKVVAPGMRIGWVVGDRELVSAFAWFKKDLDHPFAQATMAAYLENVEFEQRLTLLREEYQTKRDAMIQALEQFLPSSVTWHVPEGGYFVWVKIPDIETSCLLEKALVEGVSYIPGKYFFLNQKDGREFLRLSFSYSQKEEIIQGIQKLGKLLS
ncbi:aminotransferase [Bacillus sp. FJAT-27231]|uniref:aminotransferase-like domain-containing protein n=1 Tax=Bacillus sp. FJAT-27231 TaxID=1679168 RepID=UPI0006717DDB|nr:PLP-dependent aminotransferase family protein [Bacillus sp. FJAT-27231]KMY54024.1 aminotransferase [Bacillus sp. FJAT-27231]